MSGRRDENLKIICQSGPSYLLKQPDPEIVVTLPACLSATAAFFRRCNHEATKEAQYRPDRSA
jgi:hypothetical protein